MKFAWAGAMVVALAGCMGTTIPDASGRSFVESGADGTVETTRGSWLASFRSGPKELEAAKNAGPLPFGAVRKVCGVSKRSMGTEVEADGGFKLYDTKPSLLAPRTHYVTGFRDGCARKFTAGMAFLGDPMVHEVGRYRSTADFTPVDSAYETLKNRICRVKTGERCGDRSDQLVKSTVFVSVYRRFSDSTAAGAMLLHKGKLHATDFDG